MRISGWHSLRLGLLLALMILLLTAFQFAEAQTSNNTTSASNSTSSNSNDTTNTNSTTAANDTSNTTTTVGGGGTTNSTQNSTDTNGTTNNNDTNSSTTTTSTTPNTTTNATSNSTGGGAGNSSNATTGGGTTSTSNTTTTSNGSSGSNVTSAVTNQTYSTSTAAGSSSNQTANNTNATTNSTVTQGNNSNSAQPISIPVKTLDTTNSSSSTVTEFMTRDCIKDCYSNSTTPGWYYCSTSLTTGYCCSTASTSQYCIDSPLTGVNCGQNATLVSASLKYAFCPRRTKSCGTAGATLTPLLNVNQTVNLHQGGTNPAFMNYTRGDVCYWELTIDTAAFETKHTYAAGKLSEVYINIGFDILNPNIQVYVLQGSSRRNATTVTNLNATQLKNNRFPLSNGSDVLLIAYPTTAQIITQSMFQFTYNISTSYYPPQGLDAQLKAEIADNVDASMYWYVCAVVFGLILAGLIVAAFTVCCCKDFDPLSEFERRRRVQTKKRKLEDQKTLKEEKKAAALAAQAAAKAKGGKKGGAPQKKKKVASDSDEGQPQEEGSDIEKIGINKKGGATKKQAGKKKEALEIEKPPTKLKNDRNKHKDDFKTPLLDRSDMD